MITTDIIIVSYNDKEPLEKCIASIKEYCTNFNIKIIDNSPPNINLGFTAAVNIGIKETSAPFVWCLNSDAIVLEGAQQALIDRFSYHEKVGIVGSLQIDPNNSDRIAWGGSGKCFPAGQHLGGLISMGHCQIPSKQKWINGASMMIRRKMIDEIGLLDKSLFLLYSDSDYSYTARKNGWECWYEPRARVLHTLGKASKNSQELAQKDMEVFMKKWSITFNPDTKSFEYSELFQKLDMFP